MSFTDVRKKGTIHATISPYVLKRAEKLVEDKEFSSLSDLVNSALIEFLDRYEDKKIVQAQAQKAELIRPVAIE